MNLRVLTLPVAVAITAILASTARADAISTLPAWNGSSSVASFGEPDTATYGQTFTAPGGDLNSFTFYLNDFLNPDNVDFKAYVMEWDTGNARATGSTLFESGAMSTSNNGGAGGFEAITINTGGITLTTGSTYVAFFSASGLFEGSTGQAGWGLTADTAYLGGTFVYMNNGNNFGLLTTNPWSTQWGGDLAFEMSFGESVPEPASLTLFSLGALALARRRLRRKTAA